MEPRNPVQISPEEDPDSPEQEREEDEIIPKKPKKRLSSVGKVFGFGKLNYAMKGIIDVDPETTRRNNIGKTKEAITQVPLVNAGANSSWSRRYRPWNPTLKLPRNKSVGNWSYINE
jgi:hypothetical protein